ncbi:MAG: hypothetical protein ACLR8P_20400 [Clostridium fessum]
MNLKDLGKLPGIRVVLPSGKIEQREIPDHALSGGTGKWILVSGYPWKRSCLKKGDLLGESGADGSLMYRYESGAWTAWSLLYLVTGGK